jgi:uncharacterized protein with HEPN domain
MPRTSKERLQDLRVCIEDIERKAAAFDQTSFASADQDVVARICWSFIVIGEAIKTLPEDLRTRHPAVDWKGFARFRDVLAHQYFRIDQALLWRAVSRSLPPLWDAVSAELEHAGIAPEEP